MDKVGLPRRPTVEGEKRPFGVRSDAGDMRREIDDRRLNELALQLADEGVYRRPNSPKK